MRGIAPRGQTAVDFVVGVSLFVVAVVVVLSVVPNLTAPYDDTETPVVADRVADDLVDDQLATADGPPGTLDESATVAFFDRSRVNDPLGVDDVYRVNVTVRGNVTAAPGTEPLCSDDGTVGTCGSEPLVVGPPTPEAPRSVATATRVGTIDGRPVLITVRVWSS